MLLHVLLVKPLNVINHVNLHLSHKHTGFFMREAVDGISLDCSLNHIIIAALWHNALLQKDTRQVIIVDFSILTLPLHLNQQIYIQL